MINSLKEVIIILILLILLLIVYFTLMYNQSGNLLNLGIGLFSGLLCGLILIIVHIIAGFNYHGLMQYFFG